MDLFSELFGGANTFSFEEQLKADEEKENKKGEKKAPAAKKAASKKAAAKKAAPVNPAKDKKVKLPLTVAGRGFVAEIPGEEEVTYDDILKKLADNGIIEAKSSLYGLIVKEHRALLCLVQKAEPAAEVLDQKVTLPLCICMGNVKMELTEEDFPEGSIVTVGDCFARWVQLYPRYGVEKMSFVFDSEASVLSPIADVQSYVKFPVKEGEKTVDTDIPYLYTGIDTLTPANGESGSVKKLIDSAYPDYSEFDVSWAVGASEYEGGTYYDVLPYSTAAIGTATRSSVTSTKKKAEKY